MRLRHVDAPYIANKIAIDLANSGIVRFTSGLEKIVGVAQEILEREVDLENRVDVRVKELMGEHEEEIQYSEADQKQLFWMLKRRLAPEYGLLLDKEERFSSIAHQLLDIAWNDDLMEYDVPEIKVKNIIVKACFDYFRKFDEVEKAVLDRMEKMKRKVVQGSEEYDMMVTKLFEEELRKRGMM
ncbi:MAG: DUF507 family protein [Campylobacterales bacterium]